jgi:hypothetical protein
MANPSSLSGQRLGAYEVGPLIGAGGMGEVYRARDAKLNREVAIKVLLPAVAGDAERLARFRREAQTLASLNHSGIAQIHGIEDSSGGPFLVMELVEGPTLADRIAAGAIPVDEAIAIARQIVDALEAAHERGIIHRDLKPANIKVRDDGAVKILDFGLAKALDRLEGDGLSRRETDAADSPTITSPAMTQAGLILGTAAYMSPEQAKGRVVDKRTDLWAFGCVLYEMLTARRAFDGEDVTETIAAVIRGEPNWGALPQDTPPQIRLLLKRCLEKDRGARISDAGTVRFLITERLDFASGTTSAARISSPWLAAAAVIGLAIGAVVAGWALARPPAVIAPVRFTIVPPPSQPVMVQGTDRDLAISPDGSFIVYRSGGDARVAPQLVIRPMAELEGRTLPGTATGRNPFVSPDSRWVGFASMGELRKVSIAGGLPVTLCKIDSALRGATWGIDDTIVFSTTQRGALQRVPASGGEPEILTTPDRDKDEFHALPFFLPGGRALLFTSSFGSFDSASVKTLDLTTRQQSTVLSSAHDAAYLAGDLLVYATTQRPGPDAPLEATLRVARFDSRRLQVIGDSVGVQDQVVVSASTAANYSISASGHLVYLPVATSAAQAARRSLVWVDRKGQERPIAAPLRAYAVARISPDETRIVLDTRDQSNDILTWDLKRQTLTPLNRDAAQDMSPVWTPDGSRILWTSTRAGTTPNLYWQAASGTGAPQRVSSNPGNQFPTSISPDGSQVVLFGAVGGSTDLFRIRLIGSDGKVEPLLSSPAMELGPEISPDGKWLAYHSNESGEYQVYVRPFPNVQDDRVQISTAGGSRAAWAHSGRELFYLDAAGLLMSVMVKVDGKSFSAGQPAKILNNPYYAGTSALGLDLRAYDVSRDGQRFLMIRDASSSDQRAAVGMNVVLNWLEEVKARLR